MSATCGRLVSSMIRNLHSMVNKLRHFCHRQVRCNLNTSTGLYFEIRFTGMNMAAVGEISYTTQSTPQGKSSGTLNTEKARNL